MPFEPSSEWIGCGTPPRVARGLRSLWDEVDHGAMSLVDGSVADSVADSVVTVRRRDQ